MPIAHKTCWEIHFTYVTIRMVHKPPTFLYLKYFIFGKNKFLLENTENIGFFSTSLLKIKILEDKITSPSSKVNYHAFLTWVKSNSIFPRQPNFNLKYTFNHVLSGLRWALYVYKYDPSMLVIFTGLKYFMLSSTHLCKKINHCV